MLSGVILEKVREKNQKLIKNSLFIFGVFFRAMSLFQGSRSGIFFYFSLELGAKKVYNIKAHCESVGISLPAYRKLAQAISPEGGA